MTIVDEVASVVKESGPGRGAGSRGSSSGPPVVRRRIGPRPPQPLRTLRTPGDELQPWVEDAACRSADPELFFPVGPTGYKQSRTQVAKAKAVCMGCPVIRACRVWALTYPRLAEFGVWGGTTEQERAAQRRTRRLAETRVKPPVARDNAEIPAGRSFTA